MHLIFFSPAGWRDWDVEYRPLIRTAMPVLVDDDLQFESGSGIPRPAAIVNRWLCELPLGTAKSANTWEVYARALKGWCEFLAGHGAPVFGTRAQLRAALSGYTEYRLAGPLEVRLAESSWNLHVGAIASFYTWAVEEDHATAVPFSYAAAKRIVEGRLIDVRRNLAKVRAPKAHTTIKYLAKDFTTIFIRALEGFVAGWQPGPRVPGLHPGRNAAMSQLVLSSGLRRREFTYLLAQEVPPLPPEPILLPVASKIAKGGKQRTTWVSYEALSAVHRYLALERPLAVEGSTWQPDPKLGKPLTVTSADGHGGVINGRRRSWSRLSPTERLRLVDDSGKSLLLAAQRDGSPFVDWPTVFRRASDDIREKFEPRFPHVHPHRLRHSMAMSTLESLVAGYYEQAAKLVADTDNDAALALYLGKADPIQVLRDLLGHSSVTVTEVYLSRLDTTRVFRDAYERVGQRTGLSAAVKAEVDAEFTDGEDDEHGEVS